MTQTSEPIRIGDEVYFAHFEKLIREPGPLLAYRLREGHTRHCLCGQCQHGRVSAVLPATGEIDVMDSRGHQWRMK